MLNHAEWKQDEHNHYEEISYHEPPETEMIFYRMVQQGDIDGVEKNLRSGQYHRIAVGTPLSTDMVQNFRYHSIVTFAMITRYCIDGGMPGEQAYRMSDFYIRKIDAATTTKEVEEIHDTACMDFTKRMQQMQHEVVYSKPVLLCMNYIYAHLNEKISVETLAEVVGLHQSYLSRLFRHQMGCTLHNYILDQKIQRAKQLMQVTTYSFAEIANLLSFSSQSHFIQVFSKREGITPKQYRDTYLRSEWRK